MHLETVGEVERVGEGVRIPRTITISAEGEGSGHHDGGRSDDYHHRADHRVCAFVRNPSMCDALVNDVRLLKEQLPRRDRGSDDGDDKQHAVGFEAALNSGNYEVLDDGAQRWMTEKHQRDAQQVAEEDDEHQPLPGLETTRHRDTDKEQGGERHRDPCGNPEVLSTKRDADELCRDRQEVEDEQVADGEATPNLAVTLEDEPGVADTGNGSEAYHHLLVDDEDGDEQQQGPEQAGAIVLPRRRVRRNAARIVVTDHHDETRTDDHGKCEQPPAPAARSSVVVLADGPERAPDVALVLYMPSRGRAGRHRGIRPARLLLRQFGPPTVDDSKTERARPLRRSRVRDHPAAGAPESCRDWGLSPPSMYCCMHPKNVVAIFEVYNPATTRRRRFSPRRLRRDVATSWAASRRAHRRR